MIVISSVKISIKLDVKNIVILNDKIIILENKPRIYWKDYSYISDGNFVCFRHLFLKTIILLYFYLNVFFSIITF